MSEDKATAVKAALRKRKETEPDSESLHLSTGLTLGDLAMSGQIGKGLLGGHFYLLVGDSEAGKSWLMMQIMAEAAANPKFNDYQIVRNNPERGSLMNVRRYFGGLADRMQDVLPPSKTLEAFYTHLNRTLKVGPTVYGLDSEDALPPEADLLRAEKEERAAGKPKKAKGDDGEEEGKKKGSYGVDKAKANSSKLRIAHNNLDNGSILLMIKQTRMNIGPDAYFNPKTRSGGLSLTFFATTELWFSVRGKLRRKVGDKSVSMGTILRITIKKNRTSGRSRAVDVVFYPDTGFDDVGSNIRYLVDWEHWEGRLDLEKVVAPEFNFEGGFEKLARQIEDKNQERELRLLVAQRWNEVEDKVRVIRKPRYQ